MQPPTGPSSYDLYTLINSSDPSVQFSPFVWKTIIALRYLDVPFTQKPLTFDEIRTKLARDVGDEKVLVPVLKNDQGGWMKESFDIAEYLDLTHALPNGKSLFLGGKGGKQFCRFIDIWSTRTLAPELAVLILPRVYNALPVGSASKKYFLSMRYGSSPDKASSALKRSYDPIFLRDQFIKARRVLSVVETMLEYQASQGKKFIGGDFSYADTAIFAWYLFSTRWVPECKMEVWEGDLGSMRYVKGWVGSIKAIGVISEEECRAGQQPIPRQRL